MLAHAYSCSNKGQTRQWRRPTVVTVILLLGLLLLLLVVGAAVWGPVSRRGCGEMGGSSGG
jgi:hypothetical protein